jgi:hypothetical protein
MSEAIERIVSVYERYRNRRGLEELRSHWQKLQADLAKHASQFEVKMPAGQIKSELALIEAALARLDRLQQG